MTGNDSVDSRCLNCLTSKSFAAMRPPPRCISGSSAFTIPSRVCRRGSLKTALLDQSLLAGIGNVYSDEILFHFRRHPRTDVQSLDDESLRELYRTCRCVLETAIRHHVDPSDMPSGYLLPHRDLKSPCPRCDSPLEKTKVGSRTAVYCPQCQAS